MAEYLGLRTVLARCLDSYAAAHTLDGHQWQVCRHVLDCRTEAMGGLQMCCEHCDYEIPWYFACRDRHCPRCGRGATEAWCGKQRQAALPVTYHHLVFTLPHELNPWVQLHPRELYGLWFESVSDTLKAFGADPKRLDGQIGATLVLHTWGQNLSRHVHMHCLVPGGAWQKDGHWKDARSTYLFPVRALSHRIRGHLVSRLRRAWNDGKLSRIEDPAQVDAVLGQLMGHDWVVYSKPAIERTDTLVGYLARYTHRIALSDSRILGIDPDNRVALHYKDYRDGQQKVLQLDGEELIRRYLLHVLPPGFMRIRHYGFLANRCRAKRLAQIREDIAAQAQDQEQRRVQSQGTPKPTEPPPVRCPRCRTGHLRPDHRIEPRRHDAGGGCPYPTA